MVVIFTILILKTSEGALNRHIRSYGIDSNVGLVTEAATGGDL